MDTHNTDTIGIFTIFRSVLLVSFIQIFALVILIPSHYSAETVTDEHAELINSLGDSGGKHIVAAADNLYLKIVRDTGLENAVNNLFPPMSRHNPASAKIADIGENILPFFRDRAKTFLYTLYLIFLRAAEMLIWLMPLGLFAIPLLTDGFLIWKKRKLGYDGASPTSQASALKLGSFLTVVSVFIFLLPVKLPLWVVSINLLLMLLSLYVVCRNLYK